SIMMSFSALRSPTSASASRRRWRRARAMTTEMPPSALAKRSSTSSSNSATLYRLIDAHVTIATLGHPLGQAIAFWAALVAVLRHAADQAGAAVPVKSRGVGQRD